MAGSGMKGGQRGNLSSPSGRKERSATRSSPVGSRVDPSHVKELARETREKKAASALKKTGKKKTGAKKK